MVRDFTEETKARLKRQIDDINEKEWCWLTDKLGDIATTAAKWLGILKLDDDMSNVKSYQRAILDKTDMTKKELNKIFENVYAVDNKFKGKFGEVNNKESTYNSKLKKLSEMINPNFSIATSKQIKEAVSKYNKKLADIDGKIAKDYIEEMDWASKQALKDAGKHFLKGLAKMATGIGSIMGGNALGTMDVINGFFELGSSLETALNLGGYAVSGAISNLKGDSLSEKLKTKSNILEDAEKTADNKGLADVLRDNGWETAGAAMDVVDVATDIVDFSSGAEKFLTGKGSKIFDGDLGFKIVDKADDCLETLSKGFKNVSKGINYVVPIYEYITGDGMDSYFKSLAKGAIPVYNQIQSLSDTIKDGVDKITDALGF